MGVALLFMCGFVGTQAQAEPSEGPDTVSSDRRTSTRGDDAGSSLPSVDVTRAPSASTAITFSEFPEGTPIAEQYVPLGVRFGGSEPFITSDTANPTSPVLSGSPVFEGTIEIEIVDPASGAPAATTGLRLDVGYIDNRNSVEIAYYSVDGSALGAVRANAYGINTVTVPVAGIHRVTVTAVEAEEAGFAIDNVILGVGIDGVRPERMVALGDSYSSGEGLIPEKGLRYDCGTDLPTARYFENTNVSVFSGPIGGPSCDTTTQVSPTGDITTRPARSYQNLCHRNRRAWPNQARERLGLAPGDALFVACSGAVTGNIGLLDAGNSAQYAAPGSPNGVAGGNTQIVDARNFRDAGAPVDLVLVGIGGNDASFAEILRQCLLEDCLAEPGWAESQLARINSTVYDNLVTTFTRLRDVEFPGAAVLAYGYPSVVTELGQCAGVRGAFGLYEIGAGERAWAADVLLPELNQAVQDAAATAGITYMPIDAVTRGHEVCSSEPWVNGLRLGNDVKGVIGNESFHPNQWAHDAIAQHFITHYTDGDGALTFSNPAPNPNIRPGVQSITFNVGRVTAEPGGECGASCLQPACSPSSCGLGLHLQGFAPDTELQVVLHSDPTPLGIVTTDAEGSVSVTLPVPDSVADGLHHVEVTGVSGGIVQEGAAFVRITRVAPRACDAGRFSDVAAGHLFCADITWMADEGLAKGYLDGSFGTTRPVTRQAVAAWLFRRANPGITPAACTTAPFADVGTDHLFCPEITWMVQNGYANGYADGTFEPHRDISRQVMAAFLFRLDEATAPPSCPTDTFVDVAADHPFCTEIAWLAGTGITEGYDDGMFRPSQAVSRQSAAAFLWRYDSPL